MHNQYPFLVKRVVELWCWKCRVSEVFMVQTLLPLPRSLPPLARSLARCLTDVQVESLLLAVKRVFRGAIFIHFPPPSVDDTRPCSETGS